MVLVIFVMRLKKIPGALERVEASSYVIKDGKKYVGHYQSLFPKKQPIHIEIGMGKGKFIVEMAERHPEINYIGIEKYDSVLMRALEKQEEKQLPNLILMRQDAGEIDEVFDHEIDRIYLNFSDPWPKKRHAKRRLSSPDFLKEYDSIFRGKKEIIMKTDNRKLFEYSIMSMTEYGYHIREISLDLYQDQKEEHVQTEYEIKFHNLGYPIYWMRVDKG